MRFLARTDAFVGYNRLMKPVKLGRDMFESNPRNSDKAIKCPVAFGRLCILSIIACASRKSSHSRVYCGILDKPKM